MPSRTQTSPAWLMAGCLPALLSALSGCALSPANEAAKPRFTLAANGLPAKGIWKSNAVFRDIDRDGRLDLAAHLRLGDGPEIWRGDGRGSWTRHSAGLAFPTKSCGGGLAVADLNRDGQDDVAVADHCTGVYVFLGDGRERWKGATAGMNSSIAQATANEEVNPYTGTEYLALGDVNEDGAMDLVASASDRGGFSVYLGDGSGSVWQEQLADGLPSADDPEEKDIQKGGWATRFLLRDLDGDGHLDVAASYYTGPRVWRGDGKGRWKPGSRGLPAIPAQGALWEIAAGDVNEDGRQDLVVANNDGGPELFLQQPDGAWQAAPAIASELEGGVYAVALGDLDRDGHLDLALGGRIGEDPKSAYGLNVLRGNGKGDWSEWGDTGLPDSGLQVIWGITTGDVNGDGRLDLAVTTGASRPLPGAGKTPPLPPLQVWLNQGPGATRPPGAQ